MKNRFKLFWAKGCPFRYYRHRLYTSLIFIRRLYTIADDLALRHLRKSRDVNVLRLPQRRRVP